MKKIFILFMMMIVANIWTVNQQNFLGFWKTKGGKSIIKIYKKNNGEFAGKIVWLAEPLDKNKQPKTDSKNPNENLKNRPLLNLELLQGFHYKDSVLKGGKIYDPKSGKTYNCIIKYKNSNLVIRGFIGISLFGRSETWERTEMKINTKL